GWLAAFIGNLIKPNGKLTSYERDERWFSVAKANIKSCNLEKVVTVKKGDVIKAAELKRPNSLDLITLDIKEPELIVPKAAKTLKPGGFLAIFSPHIEQQKRVREAMRKMTGLKGGLFASVKTVETIQRPWQVNGFTHPEISGLLHTCFLTVARKIK
ncbi:MAG: methyltransferase domain-containing protein, partial [Candidatus Aenigmatarchaeota archaeon]